MTTDKRAQLTASAINNLPDSDFAYIEPGGRKDSEGKTVPRSLRHFPIHDAAHVRNALARAPQSPYGRQAMPKIMAAAKRLGITVNGGRSQDELASEDWIERRFVGEDSRAAYHTAGIVEVRDVSDGPGPNGKRIAGYASVFNRTSKNLGGFVEEIDPGAFNRAQIEGFPGAVARYNHDPNMLLGTMAGRTLALRIDAVGLFYDVLPPQSRADILELVQRGDIRHSSFAFRVSDDGEEWSLSEQKFPQRRVYDVELVDVAPVVNPAYPDATAGLRSFARHFDIDYEEVRSMADTQSLSRVFAKRSDGKVIDLKPKPKPKLAALAMVELMNRRRDPADEG